MTVPHQELWNAVFWEIYEVQVWPGQAIGVANHVRNWSETRNPFYLDAAVHALDEAGIGISPSVARELAKAARLRLDGVATGGMQAVKNGKVIDEAMKLMMNLTYGHRMSIAKASIKTAFYIANKYEGFGAKRYKASGLERMYSENISGSDSEAVFFDYINEHVPDHKEKWDRVMHLFPDAPEDLQGSRR